MKTQDDPCKVQSVLMFFIWMIAHKHEIQLSDENLEFDFNCGLCHNIVEFTEDHSGKILQKLFRNYLGIPKGEYVPNYPFGTTEDFGRQYETTDHKYLDNDYGNLRWTFVEWAIKELETNGKSYIND